MANSYSDSLTDPKIMDQSVKPTEDFYRHANGTWLKEHEIPSDRPSDGAFYKLRDEAEEHIHTIVEALDPASADVEEQKLATLYSQFMDEEAVEALGAKPLAPDFAIIDQAETHAELAVTMGKLATTGVGGILEAIIDADMNDPARYTVFTYQAGISLPDEAYYREDQYETVRQGLVTYLNKAREIIAADAQFEGWAGAVGEAFGADVLAFATPWRPTTPPRSASSWKARATTPGPPGGKPPACPPPVTRPLTCASPPTLRRSPPSGMTPPWKR